MQVSRRKNLPRSFKRTPLATGVIVALASPALMAQDDLAIEEVVVTAQKRAQNMQDVPISIQYLGGESLQELNLSNFREYVRLLPSATTTMNGTAGAGTSFNLVYMRGIATAGDGQATTSQPSVAMYLDELQTTTIQGNLDIHMYDIARVEALAGPQGTLFGASSQAGTIRVITNKPDSSAFSAGFGVEANTVDEGDSGHVLEGYVNVPLGDSAAIRLVGWNRNDAGWIDNVAGTRTYPGVEDAATCAPALCSSDDVVLDNSAIAKNDYNTTETTGARAALRVDLGDNWTISPTVMAQSSKSEGSWGDDLSDFVPGDYAVTHFRPEFVDDEWYMVGLTIEGSIGNWDLVYAGSYLDRQVDGSFDYTDYSYWYDSGSTTGFYADLHFADTGPRPIPNQFAGTFPGAAIGTRVMSGAQFTNDDGYTKENHEIRISSPQDNRVRGMLGFFWQHQFHDFEQHWQVAGGVGTVMRLNSGSGNPRFTDTVYLNSLYRNDRDRAFFGNVSFDITDDLELNLGARFFEPEVTVEGFFGFGMGFNTAGWSGTGEAQCNLFPEGQQDWGNKPCRNVRKGISESESIGRVNLTYSVNDDSMIYFTWSQGYRPGGINRAPAAGEYISDFLTNWEFGWKSQWMDNRVQFNGAVFFEEWDDFQVSFTGANAITQVDNGPTAHVLGSEMDLTWLATDNLRITGGVALYSTELQDDYVDFDAAGNVTGIKAPKGTSLPVTADFKGNVVARYSWQPGTFDAFVQGAVVYEGSRGSDMDQADNAIVGDMPAYTLVDLSAGFGRNSWMVELFIKNATGEDAPLYLTHECVPGTCGVQVYGVRARPTTIAARLRMDFN